MKIKVWFTVLSFVILYGGMVQIANAADYDSDDVSAEAAIENSETTDGQMNTVQKAKLIPLARNKDGQMQEIEAEVEPLSVVEKMSLYVKELNLTSEQVDLAKYISDDSRLKQEQLLKSVYLLKEQARTLEEKTLNDFRAILTPEQRKKFDGLRAWYERQYNL